MISFDEIVCRDHELAKRKEWLETNGLGGYASSSILGLSTRRFHGLLVADAGSGLGRFVFLSKLDEALMIGHLRYMLTASQLREGIFPRGYDCLVGFRLDPFPVFTYRVQGVEIEKSLFMIHGQNAVVVIYEIKSGARVARLEIRPLIAFRDYGALSKETPALNSTSNVGAGKVTIEPYSGLPRLHFFHQSESYSDSPIWYKDFLYFRETEDKLDDREDLYSPGFFIYKIRSDTPLAFVASLSDDFDISEAIVLKENEIRRRKGALKYLKKSNEFLEHLTLAVNSFIVKRYDGVDTMLAGYHWFGDWARDTFIGLPGIFLRTGHVNLAKRILKTFADLSRDGLISKLLPELDREPEYDSLDVPLWYVYAVYKYLLFSKDNDFVLEQLYPVLLEIISAYQNDNIDGLRLDDDALLVLSEEGAQATWMEGRSGSRDLHSGSGKTVELNALWYNGLMMVAALSKRFRKMKNHRELSVLASKVKLSFNKIFWNGKTRCLYDSVERSKRDHSIRPNQIFAISLPFPVLTKAKYLSVLQSVERHLLTPYGLRSLSSKDNNFRGQYVGDQSARDGAYYNGTVWPWLMGQYITAYLRVNKTKKAKERAKKKLEPFNEHLRDAGLGTISEIFDGKSPYAPKGCISQAWSVGELLRVIYEEKLI